MVGGVPAEEGGEGLGNSFGERSGEKVGLVMLIKLGLCGVSFTYFGEEESELYVAFGLYIGAVDVLIPLMPYGTAEVPES